MYDTDLFAPIIDVASSMVGRRLRRRRADRRGTAGAGGPRPGHDHAGRRRRAARQRGPGLRAAPDRSPRRHGGAAARGGQADRPRPGRGGHRHARRRVAGPARPARPHRQRGGEGGGGLRPHAAGRVEPTGGGAHLRCRYDRRRRRVHLARHARLPGRAHRGARTRCRGRGRPGRLRRRHGRAAGEGRVAAKSVRAGDEAAYRALLECRGPDALRRPGARGLRDAGAHRGRARGRRDGEGVVEVFLDRTPFYAEAGGQVGDTGTIVTETGIADVSDTVYAVPGLVAHRATFSGEVVAGQDALATIDGERREAIRRNHTATHLLHAALRQVLGDHVRQQGSLVDPDYLRFDFSHHAQPSREELDEVFERANDAVLGDAQVETTETSREEAERMGAIAFFGDKYGASVRVVQAGDGSLEFCGGTHVAGLGRIGPISLDLGRIHRVEHAADLRPHGQALAGAGRRAGPPGPRSGRVAADRTGRAAGRDHPGDGAPARGRAGAGPAAPAGECGRGRGAGGRRGVDLGRGGGAAGRGGARRAALAGPGRAEPRRRARGRAGGITRRARPPPSPPPPGGPPTPPSSSGRWARWWAGAGADRPSWRRPAAGTRRRSRRRWPRRGGS